MFCFFCVDFVLKCIGGASFNFVLKKRFGIEE